MQGYADSLDVLKCNRILPMISALEKDIHQLQELNNRFKDDETLQLMNEGFAVFKLWDATDDRVPDEAISAFQNTLFHSIVVFSTFYEQNKSIELENDSQNGKFKRLMLDIGTQIETISKVAGF